jgi:hypothetical protein
MSLVGFFFQANEVLLFHGFKASGEESLAKTGLDVRLGKRGLHGLGIYTAESSLKAHGYTGKHCFNVIDDMNQAICEVI